MITSIVLSEVAQSAINDPNYIPYCRSCNCSKRMTNTNQWEWQCIQCRTIHNEHNFIRIYIGDHKDYVLKLYPDANVELVGDYWRISIQKPSNEDQFHINEQTEGYAWVRMAKYLEQNNEKG